MNKFNPLKARFRATFSGSQLGARLGKIDEENEVLHDVQITLEGEAKGHGVFLDREFCEAVAEQGNATGDVGLKVRYGHPAMCSDAIGTELGRAKNFRVVDVERPVDGGTVTAAGVLADVHLLKSAHSAPQGDIAKHVMETAKEDPSQFGQSIVFTYSDWVVKDKDGNRHSYRAEVMGVDDDGNDIVDPDTGKKKPTMKYSDWLDQSADGREYAVLGKLHGSDFTDTPAATDGIFSTGTLAEEAEQMLAEHPQILEVLEKSPKSIAEFLERTGLAEKVESARVSGLQAAKDKEIAELKATLTETIEANKKAVEEMHAAFSAERDSLKAEFKAELEKQLGEKSEEFETVSKQKQADLDAANTRVEQLTAELDAVRKDLAETREHLSAWEQHASEHGADVNTPPGEVFSDFAAAVGKLGFTAAARRYPALHKAYNINHTKKRS